MTGEDSSKPDLETSTVSKPQKRGTTTAPNRRRVLRLMGGASIAALAGCTQPDVYAHEKIERRDSGWCIEENDVEIPETFQTAESIDGIERDPNDLNGREEAAYQCHPQGYQLCANCRFFIPGRPGETGSGVGACAIVEGLVRSQDWCALYQETERLSEFPSPDPFGEDGPTKPPKRQ